MSKDELDSLGRLRLFANAFKGTSLVHVSELPPTSHHLLLECYPNPFNSETVIRYSVPTAQIVTIDLFDVLGRNVSRLVTEQKLAGTYELRWSASGVASGIYLCRLHTETGSVTKKLLLLK